ncbi:hypothetical protein CK203_090309 [Vitis vinifera]|uniref:Exostosin GT47 domain-containing protein n=1 Tax=Vitis vinifera TaxID=29760 RepID=A0A438DSE1_VITVI|nr:hypothetical protein CK203_090309 [Vitis vinifera]
MYTKIHYLTPESGPGFYGSGNYVNNKEVFHDRNLFVEDYKEMNRSFKIYCYPHKRDDPFANALLPVDFEPGVIMPVKIEARPKVGVGGIQDFIRDYIFNISQNYPYWNQTGGADHFYVACHSIGRSAMEKADEVKLNAIQVVCSSSYFLSGYIAHKDASLPQIWPRQGDPPDLASSER